MRAYVINLDRTPDRLATFRARNAHIPSVDRFSAVDGRAIDREMPRRENVLADAEYGDGALGCALSHIALWRSCRDSGRPITVVEDDAIFAPDFLRAAEALTRAAADWDIFLWGWNFDSYLWVDLIPGVSPAKLEFDQAALRRGVGAFRGSPRASLPVRLLHAFGTPAYSLSPRGAAALLDALLPLRKARIAFPGWGVVVENTSIDAAMNGVYRSMNAFVAIPPLAITENDRAASTVLAAV